MSQIKTLNGVQYTLPQYNDTGWGANTGNVLTQYMAAIADVTLQLTGGSFTLTADADFGSNFGLKALYVISETANPASAGVVRLAKTDSIKWRNNANGADLALTIDGSNNLTYATNKVYTAGGAAGIVNADIASGAAIAYSKLALTGSIVNADIGASAAIAYSKLVLTGSVLNADLAGSIAYSKLVLTGSIVNGDLTAGTILNSAINASAAIALSKLAALGTAKAVQTNSSTGFLEASSVTNTELGYLSGVTSALQTQLNATVANPLTANLAAGSHKLTGLSAGTTAGDSVRWEQILGVRVIQVVQTTGAATFSTSSTTFQITNVTVSITPTLSTSKILVLAFGNLASANSPGNADACVSLFRDTTNLGNATSGMVANTLTVASIECILPAAMMYFDSPASTSAIVYSVKLRSGVSGTTVYFPPPTSTTAAPDLGSATIIVIEVG